MRTRAIMAMGTLLLSTPAHAFDKDGHYLMGGGVGMTLCPDFLNSMATARQEGGLHSLAGANLMQGYQNYVLGFQTAFNAKVNGVLDIFAPLGVDPASQALYQIEPWCQQHPDKKFGEGVLALAEKLRPEAN